MPYIAHILTPVDPATSNPALPHALFWAQQYSATLHAVHVHPPKGNAPHASSRRGRSPAVQRVVEAQMQRTGIAPEALVLHAVEIEAPSRADGILQYAEDHSIDLILAGSPSNEEPRPVLHDHGLAKLIRQATCPVLAVTTHPSAPASFQRLLAPIDFSRHAQRGLAHAKSLAALYDASLDVLHVLERPRYVALSATDMLALSDPRLPERKALRRGRALFDDASGPDVSARFHVTHGSPAHQIAAFSAQHGNDLLVLASHGSTGAARHPLGTITTRTLRDLALPVFLVKSFGTSLAPFPDTVPHSDTST